MRILIAEDDAVSALLLERTLKRADYEVVVARNGAEALEILGRERFDALLTDWMMPSMDGIELTRRVRATIDPQPLIIVITALASEEARVHAVAAGSDGYLAKPVDPREVIETLTNCFERRTQPVPEPPPTASVTASNTAPPMVGVALAASTGGPTALLQLGRDLPTDANAAYFVVLHGPEWVIETFASSLRRETPLDVRIGEQGLRAEPGSVIVAPAEHHMRVRPGDFTIELEDGPSVNFVRPAADPLFRSVAAAFGRHCVAVVLTGMGRDGSLGAAEVASVGGSVLVQDPATAIASSMPKTVIDLGVAKGVFELEELAPAVALEVAALTERL